jgi:general secretion pathway protein J
MTAPRLIHAQRGFTLVEVLVSLLILAVLAASAWKGMDAISKAREVSEGKLKQTLRLQSVMTQWEADMAQVLDTQVLPGLEFDGGTLRLTRRAQSGVQVVSWFMRDGAWVRWASPAVTRVGELKQQWQRSYMLQAREPGALVAVPGLVQWQVYCFRGGSMSNCQSTGNLTSTAATGVAGGSVTSSGARQQLPEAIRLQLTLDERSGLAGSVLRDVMLAPQPN